MLFAVWEKLGHPEAQKGGVAQHRPRSIPGFPLPRSILTGERWLLGQTVSATVALGFSQVLLLGHPEHKVFHPALELLAGEHHSSLAAGAFDADIGAKPVDLPIERSAGVRLSSAGRRLRSGTREGRPAGLAS